MKLLANNIPSTQYLLSSCFEAQTDNQQELGSVAGWRWQEAFHRPYLRDWDKPSWEIYRWHGGHVIVAANRPCKRELCEGERNGRWGSFIRLAVVSRHSMRNALRIARRLCKTPVRRTAVIPLEWLVGIAEIQTNIKLVALA